MLREVEIPLQTQTIYGGLKMTKVMSCLQDQQNWYSAMVVVWKQQAVRAK